MTGRLTPGLTAIGGSPPGAWSFPGSFGVSDLSDLPPEYLIELGAVPPAAATGRASLGQPGAVAVGDVPRAAASQPTGTTLRLSLRGWIGEPTDAAHPNTAYPKRLLEPPSLVRGMRILPEDSARGSFQAGEVRLDNADGDLDTVCGDWGMAGRPAVLWRGPHRTPLRAAYAEFSRVAELRITGAALGSNGQVRIGLRDAAGDLSVPVSTVYAGTGGLEGDAARAGQTRPLLYGFTRQIAPVALLASQLVYQISGRALAQVAAVRDGGAGLIPTADYPTLAGLLGASVAPSHYATCLAAGLIRTGSTPRGQLTVDARGDGDPTHGGIAVALLTGPGGLTTARVVLGGFAALPVGVAGFLWTGGSVAAALDDVLGSCAGWWGSDRLGRIVAGRLSPPEGLTPRVTLERWMLDGQPSEVEGVAPRWRQRVAYRVLQTVQSATDLFGIASTDPAQVAAYGTAQQLATAYDSGIATTYPSATDPAPLVTGFEATADAQAQANALLALHGPRRRRWRVVVGKWGQLVDVGDPIAIDHPKLAGRTWIVTGSDETGDSKTLSLWG